MKLKKTLALCFAVAMTLSISSNATPTFAASQQNESNSAIIEKYDKFVNETHNDLEQIFGNESSETLDLNKIESIIESYYGSKKSEVEELSRSTDIIQDYLTEKEETSKALKKEESDIVDYIKEQGSRKGNKLITKQLSGNAVGNREVNILLSEAGGILVTQTVASNSVQNPNSLTTPIQPMALQYKDGRTDAEGYNSLGFKTITVYAKGSFSYDYGVKADVTYGEGDYSRTFWGSSLSITNADLGKTMTDPSSGYAEVYTKIHVDSVVGFRGVGLVINSNTLKVGVGCSLIGAISGYISAN